MNKILFSILMVSCFLTLLPIEAFNQNRQDQITVDGVVSDDQGMAVAGALIYGNEGSKLEISDPEGRFSINVPAGSTLRIEAEGYETRFLIATAVAGSHSVVLNKALFLMDDNNKVAVPFGQIKKREVTGAMAELKPEEFLKYDNVQFFQDALNGRVSGLLGNNNIRGIGNAVFIVDGLPRDPSNINVEEIDQITVLKDANAGILYGVYAPNGIVLVNTKRGQAFKRMLNFTVEQGISTPLALPRYLSSARYMELYNEARENDGLAEAFDENLIADYASGSNPYRYPDVDYYSDEFLGSMLPFTKILSEFSGGNDVTQYYANLGWMNKGSLYQIGEAADAQMNRFNVRGNVNIAISDQIRAFVDVVAVFDLDKGPVGNFWNDAATLHPYYYSPLLPLSLMQSGIDTVSGISFENAEIIDGRYILGGTTLYQNNVYGNQALGSYNTNIKRTAQFNQGLEFDLDNITQGLRLKTFVGLDIFNSYSQSVNNQYAVYQPTWVDNPGGTDSVSALTIIGKDVNTGVQNLGNLYFTRRFGTNIIFDYTRTFSGVHTFSGLLGGYFDQYNYEGVETPERRAHMAFRLAYDLGKKYFVDFSSAYVNGYKLEPGNKGGLSPSIGLGWIISEESVLSGNSFINFLKLRASAGIINYEFTGNDYRRYEQTFGKFSTYSWDDGKRSLASVYMLRAANPELTFEKMKNINLGVEGYFFNNSLYLDANIFINRNSGQVIRSSNFPAFLSQNIPYENYNETAYRGAEMGISWTRKVGDFSLELAGNSLFSTSEVIRRDELYLYDYQSRVGLSSGAMFGLEAIGLYGESDFDETGQFTDPSIPKSMFGEVRAGDIRYKDHNNDGKIDSDDEVHIGDSRPRFSYGLSIKINYKRMTLFMLGSGQEGADSYYNGSYFWVQGNDKYSEEVLGRWTPETASAATYPRLSAGNNPNNFQNSSYWLYHNNFFNFRRMQFSYDLPDGLADKIFTRSMSLFVRGENLLYISKDSEKRQLRIGAEPSYRNYSAGLRFAF